MKNKLTLFLIVLLLILSGVAACKKEAITEPPDQIIPSDTTFTDVEGNSYKAKKYGTHYWMIDNFKSVKSSSGQTLNGVYTYNNDNNNVSVYGRLYTWPAAVAAAPTGWRLPTKEEWDELINSLGGTSVAGGKLKETGIAHWTSPNTGATNSSGFTALGSGFRGPDGIFYDLGRHSDFWGTSHNGQDPSAIYIYYNSANVMSDISRDDKTSGIAFSVRYIKN